ncbi:MAG: hypothetical protein WC100_22215 [Sterolibacterium sp.]
MENEWQPIETAPKDGHAFLVRDEAGLGLGVYYAEEGKFRFWGPDKQELDPDDIKHWCPNDRERWHSYLDDYNDAKAGESGDTPNNVVPFPSPMRGKATLIIPSGDTEPDFEKRLYEAMTALLDVWDVEIMKDGPFFNAAGEEIAMYHVNVMCNSPSGFNWIDQILNDSEGMQ